MRNWCWSEEEAASCVAVMKLIEGPVAIWKSHCAKFRAKNVKQFAVH